MKCSAGGQTDDLNIFYVFRELESCFKMNVGEIFRITAWEFISPGLYRFIITTYLLPHFVIWAGVFDRFILMNPPCKKNILLNVFLHLKLLRPSNSCQSRWQNTIFFSFFFFFYNKCKIKNSIFKSREPTQLSAAHSALIWPTFAPVVVVHYEKISKSSHHIRDRGVQRIGISCPRSFSVNRSIIKHRTLELRSGKGRFDPRKSPQTCVRGRVSVGEGFPVISSCHLPPSDNILSIQWGDARSTTWKPYSLYQTSLKNPTIYSSSISLNM